MRVDWSHAYEIKKEPVQKAVGQHVIEMHPLWNLAYCINCRMLLFPKPWVNSGTCNKENQIKNEIKSTRKP